MARSTHLLFALLVFSCGPEPEHVAERPTGTVCLTIGETPEVCADGWTGTASNGAVSVSRGAQDARGCAADADVFTAWPTSTDRPTAARDASGDMLVEGCRFQAWDLVSGEVRDTDGAADFTVTMRPVDDGEPGAFDCEAGSYRSARCAEVMGRTVVTVRANVPL